MFYSLFCFKQDCPKTTKPISMKPCGKVHHGPKKNPVNFGADQNHRRVHEICFLSPTLRDTEYILKSSRWHERLIVTKHSQRRNTRLHWKHTQTYKMVPVADLHITEESTIVLSGGRCPSSVLVLNVKTALLIIWSYLLPL